MATGPPHNNVLTGSDLGRQLDQWQCKNAPGTNQDFTPR